MIRSILIAFYFDDDDDDDVDDCNTIFFAAILSLSLITPLCISFLSLIC